MSDDAEVARLMRAMGAGPSTTKPKEDTTSATGRPLVSPRGSKPVQVEDEQGLSAEEARLLRSMQATTSSAPAKKWGDVSPRGVAPTGPISPRGPSSEAMVSPRSAPPCTAPRLSFFSSFGLVWFGLVWLGLVWFEGVVVLTHHCTHVGRNSSNSGAGGTSGSQPQRRQDQRYEENSARATRTRTC